MQHPFLLITPDDVERARRGMAEDPAFRELAEALRQQAREADIEKMPALDLDWWEEIKDKGWHETYQEVNMHTGVVPRTWANAIRACARAHLLYPEEGFDAKARELLLGLSEYAFAFKHFDVGMNYATWSVHCLDAYDILYDRFSDGERERLDAFFTRMVEAVIENDAYWIEHEPGGPMNNHYAWHKLARIMYGLFYGKPEMVEEGVYGPKGVVESMRYGFTDEGLWLEASLNYQFAQTEAMLLIAEMLKNAGADFQLWDYRTGDGRTYKQNYDALIETAFPDRTLPNIGDCYGRRHVLGCTHHYEFLLRRFGDPVYAWLVSRYPRRHPHALFDGMPNPPAGDPPPMRSLLWPEHGYAMLRETEGVDYWSGAGWTAFATYSNAPVHQNQDKLSLMLYGDGRHWLVDCEARSGSHHAFSSDVQRELNRSTLCHNTVLIGNRDQAFPSRRLDLVECSFLPEVKRVTIGDLDGRLYEGVRQLRTLLVTNAYVLDFFQVQCEDKREISWLTHVNGAPEGSSADSWRPISLEEEGPWKWLVNPEQSESVSAYSESFTAGDDVFRMDVALNGPVQVIRCGFPKSDSVEPETWPMRMLGAKRKAAWFCAVYHKGKEALAPAEIEVAPGQMDHWDIAVTIHGETRRHLAPLLPALR